MVFFFFSHLIPINDDVLSFRMVAHGRTNNKDHSYHCCEAKAFVALQILVCSLNVGGGRDG